MVRGRDAGPVGGQVVNENLERECHLLLVMLMAGNHVSSDGHNRYAEWLIEYAKQGGRAFDHMEDKWAWMMSDPEWSVAVMIVQLEGKW